MAIAPSINLDKVSSGIKSLNTGMGQLKKSADNIKTVSLNKTRIKRESIARNRMLTTMREEAVKRKDQESIIEASGIGGAFKRTGSVIADSTKGFLGRLLDFASSLLLGWLMYNLPTIMTAIEDLITRIRNLYGILTDFMTNIRDTFLNFGTLLSAVYQDITQFDFTDQSKRVQSAMDDLNANMDSMHDEFMRGFKLLTTPLGQGPGEEPPAPLNTDYTQPGPTTGTPPAPSGASAGYRRIYESARKAGDPFPEVTAAQWAVESGYGKYPSGKNNPFGQKALANEPGTYMMTTENINGRNVRVRAKFRDFASEEEAIKYRLSRFGYKYGNARTPEEAIRNLQIPGGGRIPGTNEISHGVYATDPNYVSAIVSKIREEGGNPKRARTVSGESPAMTSKVPSPSKPQSGKGNGFLTSADLMKIKTLSYPADYKDWYGNNAMLNPTAGKAFLVAQKAYGKDIPVNSAYRSYEHQRNVKGSVRATPGYSKHGLGLALDLEPGTPHYNWMVKNGPKFGWYYAKIPGDPYHFEYRGGGTSTADIQSAQISSMNKPGQNVPSVTKDKRGQQIMVVDDRQPSAPQQISSGGGGGGSQPVPVENTLNSLIKNQILLELAYT